MASTELNWEDRGAILALLGSAERAFFLIDRIDAERRSVKREVPTVKATPATQGGFQTGGLVPAGSA